MPKAKDAELLGVRDIGREYGPRPTAGLRTVRRAIQEGALHPLNQPEVSQPYMFERQEVERWLRARSGWPADRPLPRRR